MNSMYLWKNAMHGLRRSELMYILCINPFFVFKTESFCREDKGHPPQSKCRSVWESNQTRPGVVVKTPDSYF
jgi:hypothetical protein